MSDLLHYYRGRVALHAILHGLGVTPGDEVVVQAYTCAAVVEPLLRLGARPVFTDIDPYTFGPDPQLIRSAVTKRTKAVVVQHTFGIPAPVHLIGAGVPVVEDCAHVVPGTLDTTGSVAAFYSYEWGKPVVAGVGGTAVVHDQVLAARMGTQYDWTTAPPWKGELMTGAEYLAYRMAARTGTLWRLRGLHRRLAGRGVVVGSYVPDPFLSPEYGWRMSRAVRRRLPSRVVGGRASLDRRRRVAAAYHLALTRAGLRHATASLPLRIPVVVADKDRVLREGAAAGVELGDWFATAVHPLDGPALAATGYRAGSCPHAEWAAAHVVTLPVRAATSPAEISRTVHLLAHLEKTRVAV
ncbi:DegT/DnrJ/EryC1/StrS family aminotransferase [Actinoplanes rectilineatus]|uniref:DegT/DnrJ/EryC1/StrS family aminotransferase n=1 Tax=Actinoplanes rectilineatus TaxID=113571 RepID=UPI00069671B8|nr:DegT/DnrJ/EryC1/StrS family aminotransferase [Actinoplanes rectilineatus]